MCQRLPPGCGEACEDGDGLVEGCCGLAALPGLALRGAQHQQAAAQLERKPTLARLRDDRLDCLYGCGGVAFGEAERGYRWIRAANETFGGRSALDVMLGGELTDLMRVRRLLDAERAVW